MGIERAVIEATEHLIKVRLCDVLIIGCVELAALFKHIVRQVARKDITVVNAVSAGWNILAGLVHCRQETSAAGGYGSF